MTLYRVIYAIGLGTSTGMLATVVADYPRIALSYASAFVSRGDLVILGTFAILWVKTFGISQGMEPAEAIATGTLVFVTTQAPALFWIPFLGFFLDRVNRVTGLVVCMSLATAGYLATMFVEEPTARSAIPSVLPRRLYWSEFLMGWCYWRQLPCDFSRRVR